MINYKMWSSKQSLKIMINLYVKYHWNTSKSCLWSIKIDIWVWGYVFHKLWTGFVLIISGGDTRSNIWCQSTMYHHNKVVLDTCSTYPEKLSTHPTPPFLYKTSLVVPRHLIWDCEVDLYHVYDINCSNIWKNTQNTCVSIFCIVFRGVST